MKIDAVMVLADPTGPGAGVFGAGVAVYVMAIFGPETLIILFGCITSIPQATMFFPLTFMLKMQS